MTNQIRNPKSETKSNGCPSAFPSFGHSVIDSSFGFRVSGFRARGSVRHSDFEFRISQGFTLVELLVVIGIIIILVGILLPVISKIRYAAYGADTQNEISQISSACSSYYSTYHAYPGPFSNDDTTGGGAKTQAVNFGTPTLAGIYFSGALAADPSDPISGANPWTVTGAENLVLGLMGGVRFASSPPLQLVFAPQEVGLGPLSLNPVNPTRTPSFFSTGSNYLMWCQTNKSGQTVQTTGAYQNLSGTTPQTFTGTPFTDPAGTKAFDCPIPVFVDRFPSPGPMPILYLRARTGAAGIVWDNNTGGTGSAGPGGGPAYYQYDLRDIYAYTYSHIGLTSTDSSNNPNSHNLTGIGDFPPFFTAPLTGPGVFSNSAAPHPNQIQNAGPYFMNTAITPTNASSDQSINATGRPRAVDQYILISAGPDGVYGTSDDITSFGSVSN
jgi:type II secretory pathway pseudopilin PulG